MQPGNEKSDAGGDVRGNTPAEIKGDNSPESQTILDLLQGLLADQIFRCCASGECIGHNIIASLKIIGYNRGMLKRNIRRLFLNQCMYALVHLDRISE